MCQTTGTLVHYSSFNSSSFILITIMSLQCRVYILPHTLGWISETESSNKFCIFILHNQCYLHENIRVNTNCWMGMRMIWYHVSGLWFCSWKKVKINFWCAVDSEERVWAINHLLPSDNFSLIQAYGQDLYYAQGWGALMSRGNYPLPQLGLAVNHALWVLDHFELRQFDFLAPTWAPYVTNHQQYRCARQCHFLPTHSAPTHSA